MPLAKSSSCAPRTSACNSASTRSKCAPPCAPTIWPNARPEAIRESVRAILTSGISHEFRTTAVVPPVDAAAAKEIAALIEGADRYVLQRFSDARVLRPEFFSRDGGRAATEAELAEFQAIVGPRVRECTIR